VEREGLKKKREKFSKGSHCNRSGAGGKKGNLSDEAPLWEGEKGMGGGKGRGAASLSEESSFSILIT